ncbi:sensor histidine kinase [Bradyrhizobium diazoefficiens]|jgi:signal transduction histidine kinase|uniref:sensor histidine kinase n=1 Tax=Bradyrhizobium diazoefficiens TaxID=1355477 RepID=UPI001B585341|nr:signal transduction histidine kinase [Bradyrhizobium japonicum]
MPTAKSKARILVVDDEAAQMRALCDTLPAEDYDAVGFTDARSALAELQRTKCDLLLADLMMPGMDGIELLRAAREIDPHLVGIIMTGDGTIATAVEAMKAGALDYILKPFKLSVVIPVLERALAVRRLHLENAELALRVRERTLELEAANRELEAFAYSVAHDLRGPLSVIVGYAETLIEDHSAQWPDQPRQLAGAILASGEHMQRLIDGLLRLSRFGRQPLSKGPVDTRALVGEVVDELRRQHAGREVFVHVGEIPGCVGDQALLRQVLVNLLSNAFKFTRTREKPLVTVIGWTEGRETVYCVRDNGAGFDMQQADKLFAAFQRFHDSDEYEGTGIGLSIASRIVQRHGGRIWASAEVGKGAAFYFSIPD